MLGLLTRQSAPVRTYFGTTPVDVVKHHGDGWVRVELPDFRRMDVRPHELRSVKVKG